MLFTFSSTEPDPSKEQYFRFEERMVSGLARVTVELYAYDVLRHTRAGVWIWVAFRERFVLSSARKRFACPTVEEARKSFLARKRRQIKILENRLKDAQTALKLGESFVLEAKGEEKVLDTLPKI